MKELPIVIAVCLLVIAPTLHDIVKLRQHIVNERSPLAPEVNDP